MGRFRTYFHLLEKQIEDERLRTDDSVALLGKVIHKVLDRKIIQITYLSTIVHLTKHVEDLYGVLGPHWT